MCARVCACARVRVRKMKNVLSDVQYHRPMFPIGSYYVNKQTLHHHHLAFLLRMSHPSFHRGRSSLARPLTLIASSTSFLQKYLALPVFLLLGGVHSHTHTFFRHLLLICSSDAVSYTHLDVYKRQFVPSAA